MMLFAWPRRLPGASALLSTIFSHSDNCAGSTGSDFSDDTEAVGADAGASGDRGLSAVVAELHMRIAMTRSSNAPTHFSTVSPLVGFTCEATAIGAPQCGHAAAVLLISFRHSEQRIIAT